jgi:hypothetical protein
VGLVLVVRVNHKFEPGPLVIELGLPTPFRPYSVKAPPTDTLPIFWPCFSVNQRFPSGPAVMPNGEALAVGTVYCVKALLGTSTSGRASPPPG